jgi:hypothetical protein
VSRCHQPFYENLVFPGIDAAASRFCHSKQSCGVARLRPTWTESSVEMRLAQGQAKFHGVMVTAELPNQSFWR